MSSMIHDMKSALEMAGGNVGFTALFLAGLFALWNSKYRSKSITGNLFWYALMVLVLIISPIYQELAMKFLPELMRDNMFLWILPTAPVILYVAVAAIEYGQGKWNQVFLVIGMVALLVLAAMTSYTQSDRQVIENNHYMPDAEYEVILQLDNYREEMHEDTILIWGAAEVMQYARMYSGRLYTLYGKDLWLGTINSQMHQIYENWYYSAYAWMENPAEYLEEIGGLAAEQNCDVLVLSRDSLKMKDADLIDVIGEDYYLYYIGDQYLVYAR